MAIVMTGDVMLVQRSVNKPMPAIFGPGWKDYKIREWQVSVDSATADDGVYTSVNKFYPEVDGMLVWIWAQAAARARTLTATNVLHTTGHLNVQGVGDVIPVFSKTVRAGGYLATEGVLPLDVQEEASLSGIYLPFGEDMLFTVLLGVTNISGVAANHDFFVRMGYVEK